MKLNLDKYDVIFFKKLIPLTSTRLLVQPMNFNSDTIQLFCELCRIDKCILIHSGTCITPNDVPQQIESSARQNSVRSGNEIFYTRAKTKQCISINEVASIKTQLCSRLVSRWTWKKLNKVPIDSPIGSIFYTRIMVLVLFFRTLQPRHIFNNSIGSRLKQALRRYLHNNIIGGQETKIFESLTSMSMLKAFYLLLKNHNLLRYICAPCIVLTYLLLSSWSDQMATYFNYMVLMLGLLYIGIPHGALDHLLAKNTQSSLVSFILKYLLIIGSYYIFWQYFPTLSLLIFIIYSSFHFGESELVETNMKVDSFYSHIKAFLMGLCILLVIILSHPQESINVMTNCIGSPMNYLDKKWTSIFFCGAILSFAYILMQSVLSKKWSYLGLMFLLMLGIKVPLIMAFGIYFIFQHSANAWEHLKIRLNLNSMQLYKKSSFYTIGALFIFLLIAFYSTEIQHINGLWAIFFMFIACISFPHFILMHVFYNSKNH